MTRKALMTPEEREKVNHLCKQIAEEKDHERLMTLVKELNDLLEREGHRLEPPPEKSQPN